MKHLNELCRFSDTLESEMQLRIAARFSDLVVGSCLSLRTKKVNEIVVRDELTSAGPVNICWTHELSLQS